MAGFAQMAESAGVESLYLVEHVAVAADYSGEYPYPEPAECRFRTTARSLIHSS